MSRLVHHHLSESIDMKVRKLAQFEVELFLSDDSLVAFNEVIRHNLCTETLSEETEACIMI